MKKGLISASMLAYLNCTVPPITPVLIVEVPHSSVTMIDKGTKTVERPSKELSAKEAADFIIKTLEEKIVENAGTTRVNGYINFNPTQYYFSYTYDQVNICEIDSSKPLFKGMLQVRFLDIDYVVNGNSTQASSYFNTVSPFYIANNFSFHQTASNQLSQKSDFYAGFPAAQKFYEEMLRYVADQLKQPESIVQYPINILSIHHKEKDIGQREEQLFQRFRILLEALPRQPPLQGNKTILVPCNP